MGDNAEMGTLAVTEELHAGGRHTGDVCCVATNKRVRDLLIQAEDFGFDPITID
jgi:hypothetical protein